ncbi:MAG: DNA replication protein [Rhodospirillales bacterium]|nr:DNA replication protein [Rhodospirillales bacterium]MSP80412.1 DNA replication protein [Rhodospirillales bacterium]
MTAGSAQFTLAFAHRPALDAEDFWVAPSNADAVSWIDRWRAWTHPVLVLHGPPGCGKTHLGQVFMAATEGASLAAADLATCDPARLASFSAVLVEDADRTLGPEGERALFHLHNRIVEAKGRLLLTARVPPIRWPVALPDLASRVRAAASVAIGAPDEALIGAILVKLFADRQVRVDPAVVSFLVMRMERSFEAARRLVSAMDAAALAERRPITVPLAAQVLARPAEKSA